MEVEMKPLTKPLPDLSIRIPPEFQEEEEYEYDRFSDNESDGSVDILGWLDEVDPNWESKMEIITVFWSWTVTVRLSENLYYAVHRDAYILDAIRQRILSQLLWKDKVRFEVF